MLSGNKISQEQYYKMRDAAYGITGEDFVEDRKADLTDVDSLLTSYGRVAEPTDVEPAKMTEDGMLIYNPISEEAAKTGALHKYDHAERITGSIELNGTVLRYSLPKRVTAYDAVPMEYRVTGELSDELLHIGANTFEEAERYAEAGAQYYDCNLPGNPDVEIAYKGYVTDNRVDGYAPEWKADFRDRQGTRYPAYETSELIRSGTMPAGDDYLWLNFTFTNIGDTILDPEGVGSFMFEPILSKKNAQGDYERIYFISTDNRWERLYDYLYPGESGEIWLLCYTNETASSYSYTEGEYRLTLRASVRNERDGVHWLENFVQGRYIVDASFDFTVTADGAMTEPNPVVHHRYHNNVRNRWLASFEEFQSSFQTLSRVSKDPAEPTVGVMYIQPAPWNKMVSLKIMHGDRHGMAAVQIPIEVESDSLSIELNPYNDNYHIKPDGSREPILMTQSMIDMRGNVQMGPDALGTGVNDLLNMKEAGVNLLNSTMTYAYDSSINDSYKFMMDCTRVLGFDFEAFSHYPYNYAPALTKASWVHPDPIPNPTMGSFGYSGMNQANGILAKHTLTRYGDLFWVRGDGVLPVAAEDTRGWLTIDHDWRFSIHTDSAIEQYQEWLKTVYRDIDELNAAYGTAYGHFSEVDPREGAVFENTHMGAYTHLGTDAAFQERTRAMAELDVYRTLARIGDYKEMFQAADIKQKDSRLWIRYEGSTWFAPGIAATTANPRYRQAYCEQRRNAVIPEILAASKVVFGGSNYDWWTARPSEVYELTKRSTLVGLTTAKMFTFSQQREVVINPVYGEHKFVQDFNLADSSLKGALVSTTRALYPVFKAVYEGGGIPGVLWQDYHCDGFITSTQYKEMRFYTQKIKEMLATEEGSAWATDFELPVRDFEADVRGSWSYPREYIERVLRETPRSNHFERP